MQRHSEFLEPNDDIEEMAVQGIQRLKLESLVTVLNDTPFVPQKQNVGLIVYYILLISAIFG